MRSSRILVTLAASAVLLAASIASAEDLQPSPSETAGDVEDFREAVRGTTREFAEAVDSFFSDVEYEEERNDTSISIKLGAEYLTKDGWSFEAQPRLRLRLPRTERRLLLEVVGDQRSSSSSDPFFRDDPIDEFEANDDGFALRLRLFEELGDVRVSPDAGVRISDFTPHLFAGVRASRDWRLTEKWLLYASQRVRVHTDRGLESNTVIRASRPVNYFKDDLFRASFELDWRGDEPGVSYTPGLSLFAPTDDVSAIAFETSVRLETEPSHQVDLATATIRYRRKVIFDWWTAEFAPRIEFAEEHDYSPNYGARMQLELDF